ncbi:hypothetical protein AN958_07552 [Leucoagaricus sp. SymC.cos]|nr:hypothetical protein AN958_07552 [Leucoagaricus sp. SymC.cos]
MSYSTVDSELPRYSASVPIPDYSFEPRCGERTLEQTPRSSRPLPEATYIRQSGGTTVVLHNQEAGAKRPTYGREATIAGSALFESSDRVSEVSLEAKTTTVLDNKRILWSSTSKGCQSPCQLRFSVRLPATFRDDSGEERPIPPTYAVDFHGVPGLFVRVSYFMQILIRRTFSQKVGFLTKTKRIFIPFEYYPRTRPHRPIVDSPCFYSGVKTTPEEWHQTIVPMKTPQNADPGQVYTHLLIPSARIYGIRDTIPFHVQLSGAEEALRAFLQPKSREFYALSASNANSPSLLSPSLSPTTSRTTSPQHSPLLLSEPPLPLWLDDATLPTLRVFLLRQVTLETRSGKKLWRNQILGEAKLVTVPPLLSTSCYPPFCVAEPQVEDHLDWEGELQVNERHNVGGWQAAGVHIKDFIALSVVPQNERTSPVYGIQLTVPVKLVTDSWTEGGNGFAVPLETQ